MIRCATYSPGYLNRQVIILLQSMGVSDQTILDLQERAKKKATIKTIFTELKLQADLLTLGFTKKTYLHSKSLQEISDSVKLNLGTSLWFRTIFKNALLTGYKVENDPIFSSMLYTIQLTQFFNLKKKARIVVPESAVLIGVVDDQGILEENEIFVQIKRDSFTTKGQNRDEFDDDILMNEDSFVLEGRIITTRNPCTHPGDIRILTGVNKPELSHLFNVVVFSSKGERPQCHKMAGGDLDGDVYFVCWDHAIVSQIPD